MLRGGVDAAAWRAWVMKPGFHSVGTWVETRVSSRLRRGGDGPGWRRVTEGDRVGAGAYFCRQHGFADAVVEGPDRGERGAAGAAAGTGASASSTATSRSKAASSAP